MRKSVIIIALISLVSFASFAQDRKPGMKNQTPEKVAELRTQRMKEKLSLTDTQYKKIYELNLAEAKKQEIRKKDEQKRRTEATEKRQKEYASILSPEQLKKWEESKQRNTEGRQRQDGRQNLRSEKKSQTGETPTKRGRN